MTSDENKFRYYPLTTNEGKALLEDYDKVLNNLKKDRKKLKEEYNKKAYELEVCYYEKLRFIWSHLAAKAGLDPAQTWGKLEYQTEARYLKDGFGAILYIPQEPHPLQTFLQDDSQDEKKSIDPLEIPKDTVLN